MQSCLWYLMFLSSVWFGSFINGAAVLNNSLVPHLTNSTLQTDIPTEFKVTLEEKPRGPEVFAISCLNLAIKIVGEQLALEEFTEKIEARAWSTSEVVISISTKLIPGHKIEKRFVVWGVYEALISFGDQKTFRAAIFTLAWRGDPVGYLAIYPNGLTSRNTSFNSPAMTKIGHPLTTIRRSSINSVSSGLSSFEDRELLLTLGSVDPRLPLDLHSTLLAVLSALCDAAQWPKNKVVPGRYTTGPSRTQINIAPGKVLNYKWLIKALTMIPEKLLLWAISDSFWVKMQLGTLDLGLMSITPRGSVSDASNAFIEANFNVFAGSATARER